MESELSQDDLIDSNNSECTKITEPRKIAGKPKKKSRNSDSSDSSTVKDHSDSESNNGNIHCTDKESRINLLDQYQEDLQNPKSAFPRLTLVHKVQWEGLTILGK